MFNKTIVIPQRTRTEYVTREVHEHRAPTDQSVALLKEMEAAAHAKVIDSVKVGDTTFECVVHTMMDGASGDRVHVAIFSLNGKKFRVEHRERDLDHGSDPHQWAAGLRDKIAEEIATHILLPALDRLSR